MPIRELAEQIIQVINRFEKQYASNLLTISPRETNSGQSHLLNITCIMDTILADLTKINNELFKLTKKLISSDYLLQSNIKTTRLVQCRQNNGWNALKLKEIDITSGANPEEKVVKVGEIYDQVVSFHKNIYSEFKLSIEKII